MTLSQMLKAKQDADRRAYDALLDIEPESFTDEVESRANDMLATMNERAESIRAAEEAEARAAASDSAALAAGAPTGEASTERAAVAVVKREERTYTAHKSAQGETSYFSDLYRSERGDLSSRARLERHAKEVEVEGEISTRAATTGSFAGLIVPQYLVEQAALVARAGRPVANTVTNLPLPDQGTVFYIPKGTTGASTGVQATENTNVSSTDEVWANVQVNVQTIAGQQDVSRQSLERGTPGLDSLIYLDLAGAYAVSLDTQVISGTGTGTKGLLNAGGNQATAFTAAATAVTFYTKIAGGVNGVETLRFLPPTVIAMHPRRWNWLVSQVDSSNRPLVVVQAQGANNALANNNGPDYGRVVGYLQGLPVITDASIPTSVGTGPEDQVLVYRAEDALLWEDGDGMPRQLRFEQTLGNQLTVKLVAYGYVAFSAERYPVATSIIGGNAGTAGFGLVAPTF